MAFGASENEPLRLVAAAAALGRLEGKGGLREEVEHPFKAIPYDPDINRDEVLKLVNERSTTEVMRQLLYSIIAIAAIFLMDSGPALIVLPVLASGVAFLLFRRADRRLAKTKYGTSTFDPHSIKEPDRSQNVFVFGGHSPKLNFGTSFGDLTLSLDARRNADGSGRAMSKQVDISLDDIESAILTSLTGSGTDDQNIRYVYLVQGRNIPETIKAKGPYAPLTTISEEAYNSLSLDEKASVRRCIAVTKRSEYREFTLTYLIRITRKVDDLSIEIHGLILPPIGERYRWIDGLPDLSFGRVVGLISLSPIAGAAMMIISPILLFLKLNVSLATIFSTPESRARKELRDNPNLDFGALASIRRRSADVSAMSFFQMADYRISEIAFTGRILRAFIDKLDEFDIDTSELREQRNTVLNQGIIVNGGEIKAENIATGPGAKLSKVANQLTGNKKGAQA